MLLTHWGRRAGRLLAALPLLAGLGASVAQAQAIHGPKRGVAYGYHSAADLRALAPGVSWWYNWAAVPDNTGAAVFKPARSICWASTSPTSAARLT